MRVLLSTYGPRRDVEQVVGLAVRLRPLGAEMRMRGLMAGGVVSAGVWL